MHQCSYCEEVFGAGWALAAHGCAEMFAVSYGEAREWMDRANCAGVDPELFFPDRGASTREAKAVCQACVVRVECLDYALDHSEKHGIWGGRSERERRRMREARNRERRSVA